MMLYAAENPRTSRRAAFSLAELVISIGILILMMALAGQVFSITIKSTGQATALTEITQQLRVLEDTLREDLRNVQPGQSVLYIEANPVNAYWTQLGKDADDNNDPSDGYGSIRDLEREMLKADGTPDTDSNGNPKVVAPRADILMFFTARKATSFVDPRISSRVQLIAYNHAAMGEYDPDPASTTPMSTTAFPTLATQTFSVPAQQWHLARRSMLILPKFVGSSTFSSLQSEVYLTGEKDFEENLDFTRDVLRPRVNDDGEPVGFPWYLPNALVLSNGDPNLPVRSKLDASPPMMMANRLGAYFLPNCASFKVEWCLDPRSTFVNGRLDGTSEVFWFDHGDRGDANRLTFRGFDPLHSLQKRIDELKSKTDAVSRGMRNRLESLLCEQVIHADGSIYSLADRFRGVTCDMQNSPIDSDPNYEWDQLDTDGERPYRTAFVASRPSGKCSQSSQSCLYDTDCDTGQYCVVGFAADDIWPAALRITVDLYDREFRLDRPIRHVMVIPVGG